MQKRGCAFISSLLLGLWTGHAAAHDTWLSLEAAPSGGPLEITLATGEHFPLRQSGHARESVVRSGCLGPQGQVVPLRVHAETPTGLLMRVGDHRGLESPLACWAETRAFQVELTPQLVEQYLREIQAPDALRAVWQSQRQQGLPWRERYTKQARVELAASAHMGRKPLGDIRTPTGSGLELLPAGTEPVRVGAPLSVQVLEDGQPLGGLSVQLVSERLPLGVWRRSDEQGRVTYTLPFEGRWLLRTTKLVAPTTAGGEWQSRFSTLLIEAQAAPSSGNPR